MVLEELRWVVKRATCLDVPTYDLSVKSVTTKKKKKRTSYYYEYAGHTILLEHNHIIQTILTTMLGSFSNLTRCSFSYFHYGNTLLLDKTGCQNFRLLTTIKHLKITADITALCALQATEKTRYIY